MSRSQPWGDTSRGFARQRDRLLVANLMQRYNRLFDALCRLVETRVLGDPLHGAFENYASKPPFSVLHPDALRAYVDGGFADTDDRQVRLKCRPADESQVYRMGSAHPAFSRFADVQCPVVIACGSETNAFGPQLIELQAARLPHARTEVLEGLGHFGPLQDPATVAAAVRRDFTEPG